MENVGEGVMAAAVHEESPNLDEAMDSPLLGVPEEVLLHICHYLPASDLVRLGWTCHRLRVVCRSPFAWGRARIGPLVRRRDLPMNGVLRIAPALHTLALSGDAWPTVDLLCCTRNVKVLVIYFKQDRQNETQEKDQVYRTILHYRHYLEKVDLSRCHDIKIFRLVDGLKKIQELCVDGSLVKTYPGSRTTVSALKLGHLVSADIAAEIIHANRNNLTSFTAVPLDWDHSWVSESPAVSAVWRELRLCTGLHEASILMPRDVSNIDSFPQLHTLTMRSLYMQAHSSIKRVFEASQVMRGLRKLILEMGGYAHRGLIKVVASSCTSLRELHLISSNNVLTAKAPRDLHVILGHIGDLESLTLSGVRVPSTVFRGMAAGELPRLTEMNLRCSELTQRGQDALEAMRTRRPDLQVIMGEEKHNRSSFFGHRCPETICQDGSDCSEDPSDDEFINF